MTKTAEQCSIKREGLNKHKRRRFEFTSEEQRDLADRGIDYCIQAHTVHTPKSWRAYAARMNKA